jgi:5'(3')-deoxyribonucleotidase
MRQIIAVDLDDVLSATAEGFALYSNERWGGDHKADSYLEEWAVFWGVSLEEALKRSTEYHASNAVTRYRHIEQALPVLGHLTSRYDMVVVTSRRSALKKHTDAWLEKYFPGLFQEVRYAGIWDASHKTDQEVRARLNQTKAEICREIGADYLIDDHPKHCIGAAEAGLKAVLFGEYKWNRVAKLPTGVTRARNWGEVKEYFDAES